jgi:hypothetical protein
LLSGIGFELDGGREGGDVDGLVVFAGEDEREVTVSGDGPSDVRLTADEVGESAGKVAKGNNVDLAKKRVSLFARPGREKETAHQAEERRAVSLVVEHDLTHVLNSFKALANGVDRGGGGSLTLKKTAVAPDDLLGRVTLYARRGGEKRSGGKGGESDRRHTVSSTKPFETRTIGSSGRRG